MTISTPFHILTFIKSRKVKISEDWKKSNITRVLLTATFLVINILLSLTEECRNLRVLFACLSSITAVFKLISLTTLIKSGSPTSKTFPLFWLIMIVVYIVNMIINSNSDAFDWEKLTAQSLNLFISLMLLLGKDSMKINFTLPKFLFLQLNTLPTMIRSLIVKKDLHSFLNYSLIG